METKAWFSNATNLARRQLGLLGLGFAAMIVGRKAIARQNCDPVPSSGGDVPITHDIWISDQNGSGGKSNWEIWGNLVYKWLDPGDADPSTPARSVPKDVAELTDQMGKEGIQGFNVLDSTKASGHSRHFRVDQYSDDCENDLVLRGPSTQMIKDDMDVLRKLTSTAGAMHTYPIPSFYLDMFEADTNGKVRFKKLPQADLLRLAKCRLGEYFINECM